MKTFIRMAPLISIGDIPEEILLPMIGQPLTECLIDVTAKGYPEFYAWLVKQGAFKHGEEGWVGII